MTDRTGPGLLPRMRAGYWEAYGDIPQSKWEAIRQALDEATRAGKTVVTISGVTLKWRKA